ncbi:hypothetical protein [Neorhodopirellula pilleata]|uniref:Phage integrase family protein n=1 Tax=Neorhodopirellula pilleata TaxID=2714738 RepID=A0A5C6A8B2_9BACT|nr:hypothetical protein [Neorhodopirellula pilleata]TWT95686.1 hypothetical protein Pla100_33280 [Neorhodopirellula pilleata]
MVFTSEQWATLKEHASGAIIPLLDIPWATGCRPKEARTLEARHIHDDLAIFPPNESNGETHSRVIFMTSAAKALVTRSVSELAGGPTAAMVTV